ncbi:DUF3606 domain-containing protein [Phenylobacterium sp. J367]|uniref:DUF3606 domain-containing protein n=1 Tax=Phenylobacterium sp. J367 TaxID=2898435 RepID=UPI00215087B9|nr:DUF3606 domain-containing protein [Phenylobacterium sp. J367]MCR5877651.1 DUF3606 domain-containing protein [Phenylobacterium sp. J367]
MEERRFDGPGDIDLGDPDEVSYWIERLEATLEELAEAVEKGRPQPHGRWPLSGRPALACPEGPIAAGGGRAARPLRP